MNMPLSSESGVADLGALSEMARGERIQKKILAANLATTMLAGQEYLTPAGTWLEVAEIIDTFLAVP